MISTWPGIMIPNRMSSSTTFEPRNVNRDSAKAAIEAKRTVSTAVTTEVMPEARYQFQMSPARKSVAYE